MGNAIILVGIKHSGKSTQGKLLAQKLNYDFIDLDDVITQISGLSPRDLYKQNGKNAFIEQEFNASKKIIDDFSQKNLVLATGGGICDNQNAINLLKNFGKFIFLKVDEEVAFSRIIKKVTFENGIWQNLPAYIEKENPKSFDDAKTIFHNFYTKRTEIYQNLADFTVELSKNTKEQNCKIILENLSLA